MISKVCVLGLGVIGLPTALHISKFYDVAGYDLNPIAVEKANQMGINSTCEKLPYADVYVIAVSTSVNEDDTPDMSNIYDVCNKISQVNPESLICIESTISLGTCRQISEKFSLNKIVFFSVDLAGFFFKTVEKSDRNLFLFPVLDKTY